MSDRIEIPIVIVHQGAPLANEELVAHAVITDKIAFVEVDMRSKYCDAVGHGVSEIPSVFVGTTEGALHLGEGDGLTEVGFPTLAGYVPRMWECARYTLAVTLLREGAR